MTIDEAIEILTEYTIGTNPWSLPDLTNAAKLGKEALKAVHDLRCAGLWPIVKILPGETEE